MTRGIPPSGDRDVELGYLRAPVEVLRGKALDLLDVASATACGTDSFVPLVERLQRVANDLGAVESLLAERAPQGPRAGSSPATPSTPVLSQDAAIVLALAGTAIPFARSRQDEAERWLRVLTRHGQVGAALQALGVSERPLETLAQPPAASAGEPRHDAVGAVAERATEIAGRHGARSVGTSHILVAVLTLYGALFDRALYAFGTTRDELLQELAGWDRAASSG